jgi:hypothetical protein
MIEVRELVDTEIDAVDVRELIDAELDTVCGGLFDIDNIVIVPNAPVHVQ